MKGLVMVFLGLGFGVFVAAAIIIGIYIVAYWKIFKKAGEGGWKALIPVYGTYTEYKLIWKTKMFGLLVVFAVVAAIFDDVGGLGFILFYGASLGMLVMRLFACIKLSTAFGHDGWFAVGLVFLNPVFLLILAFDRSVYVGNGNE